MSYSRHSTQQLINLAQQCDNQANMFDQEATKWKRSGNNSRASEAIDNMYRNRKEAQDIRDELGRRGVY